MAMLQFAVQGLVIYMSASAHKLLYIYVYMPYILDCCYGLQAAKGPGCTTDEVHGITHNCVPPVT